MVVHPTVREQHDLLAMIYLEIGGGGDVSVFTITSAGGSAVSVVL